MIAKTINTPVIVLAFYCLVGRGLVGKAIYEII